MPSVVIWKPEPLNARLLSAAPKARQEWAAVARTRCVSKRVAASISVVGDRVAAADPLAPIIESGAHPHEIEPKSKKALKLADGGFAASVQHPGSPARPFLRPTLPLWPSIYRRLAALAFRGF